MKRVLNREILPKYGLNLDAQSEDIWLPPDHKFELLHDFKNVRVKLLDAIASGKFPHLVERIENNGGDLEYFVGGENEDE